MIRLMEMLDSGGLLTGRCNPIVERRNMQIGDRVEVHTRFNNTWVPGFEVAAVVDSGYRLCRTSDGTVLPTVTSRSDLRPEPLHRSAHPTDG